MDAKLVVVGENAKPSEIKLNLPVTIGRGRRSSLVLPLPMISRRHCEIFEANGHLVVRDLDSMNGTYINKSRIKQAILAPGELLTVGTITFRAVYEVGRVSGTAARKPEPLAPPPALLAGQQQGSDSEDRRRTQDAEELNSGNAEKPADAAGDDISTEVSDVDPQEFVERLREANRRNGVDS